MGLFGRQKAQQQPPSVPESYLRGMRDLGEFLAGESRSYNSGLLADLAMLKFAHEDPAAYIAKVAAGIRYGLPHIRDYAGPACLGAADVAVDTLRIDPPDTEAWQYILDTAIEYARASRIPLARIKPYLRARWELGHPSQEW